MQPCGAQWVGRRYRNQNWKICSSRSSAPTCIGLRVTLKKLLVVNAISRATKKHKKVTTM
jgi:hypothetical protein